MESQKTKLQPEKHGTEKHDKPGSDKKGDADGLHIRPSVHRLMLQFLNEAVRAEDLMYGMPTRTHVHPSEVHPEHHDRHKPHEIIKSEVAKKIIEFREWKYPLGFRHWRELLEIRDFHLGYLDDLISQFSNAVIGQWNDFPVDIPRRGDGTMDGVVHAILLKTGKVLFITADQTTLLWNPEDTSPATFENPSNQPHTMPGGYSQICGHHTQLSDSKGSVLSVGGGGYGPNPIAKAGYIFDPETQTWHRTANDMVQNKWYPTAVSLAETGKVLIASGKSNDGDMELFDEYSETFQPITGDDMIFPNLYPGLHILPQGRIFYSRTGFGTAGAGPGGTAIDDPTVSPNFLEGKRPAYFTFNAAYTGGTWQKITQSPVNRVKGMSVMLLRSTAPYVRILVLGGVDNLTNDTYEIFDASILTPASAFGPPEPVPDGQHRTLCSGVLLPDGNLFVCGGIASVNSPCTQFNNETNTWSAMASLPSIRDYHSTAILLPSGKVMMAGWMNAKIEVYSPPYLFKGPRPEITSAPSLVHHNAEFIIESPQAASLVKVVFVRPMAVTHQTDSEQRVIEVLPFIHDHVNPTQIKLRAPDGGGHPHPMAPRGHYMMFAIDVNGVPSVAKWIYLH
jgi:hypothetical protein